MPIRRLGVILIFTGLLCGCSAVRSPEQLASSVQEQYAGCSEIRATAEIRADSGEEYTDYTVEFVYETGDPPHAAITVCKPDSIAGITAEYAADSGTLTYADTVLQTLLPERGGLTPVDAAPAALYSLTSEQPSSVWTEEETLVLRYEEERDEGTVVRELSLDLSDGLLRTARIFCNGTQMIVCHFSDVQIR